MVPQQNGSVHTVEVSWDDMMAGPQPLTPQQLFHQAVIAEAAKAKAAMPQVSGRIERARDLVLAGQVTRQPDSSFAVGSGSTKGKTYIVDRDGHCDCLDAVKVDGRCKHLIATWIWRRARAAVEAGVSGIAPAPDGHADARDTTPVGDDTAATQPPDTAPDESLRPNWPQAMALPPLPEAPASVNVHVELAGRKVQLTLRDSDEIRLLERLEALLARFPLAPEAQVTPVPSVQQTPSCRYHGTQKMTPSKYGDNRWVCSIKLDDGSWCNQPWPRKERSH